MSRADRDRWDERYRRQEHGTRRTPAEFLEVVADRLPTGGSALDVASGAGRNALWLARRGLDVIAVDISPVGLAIARERAREAGVPIRVLELDLEHDPLPTGPWDVIVQVGYLQRDLFSVYPKILKPGGHLVVVHATRRNLERHARPPAAFLLDDGEILGLIEDLEIVLYEEGWTDCTSHDEKRHLARLLARRPGEQDGL